MSYDIKLADRLRERLSEIPGLVLEEKGMFGGLAFMVNGKMCMNVSGENLMCRFDPSLTPLLAEKTGFVPMVMKGKELSGYCYVEPVGFRYNKDFEYWVKLCLDYNETAKASKRS